MPRSDAMTEFWEVEQQIQALVPQLVSLDWVVELAVVIVGSAAVGVEPGLVASAAVPVKDLVQALMKNKVYVKIKEQKGFLVQFSAGYIR